MMFKQQFHEGIADGTITRTIRCWKRLQVKEGGYYKIYPVGSLEVISIQTCTLDELSIEDAMRSGFADRDELIEILEPAPDRLLYRIDFNFVGHRKKLEVNRDAATGRELIKLQSALELRDKNSKVGPWTRDTIIAICKNPGLSSTKLALMLGREKAALKQDVRKLKKLGLTISLETGYELSERGKSWLKQEM